METQELQIQHYLRIFWRRKWFILLAALVAGGGALAVTAADASTQSPPAPSLYEARTTVVMDLSSGASSPQLAEMLSGALVDRSIQTQIRLMRSRNVLQRAAMMLHEGSDPPQELLSALADSLSAAITIQPITGTNLLEVRATASSPDLARQRADALVQAYIEYIKASQTQAIEESLQATRASLELAQNSTDLAVQTEAILDLMDRQVTFVLSLLNDDVLGLEELANGVTTPAAPQSASDILVRELPSHTDTLTVLITGLSQVRTRVNGEGLTGAANSIETVRSGLESVRQDLNALLASARGGQVSGAELGGQARTALSSAALGLDIANRQLQAVISLGGFSPISYGELGGLASLVTPARSGITTLAQQVNAVPAAETAPSASPVASRLSFALELLDGIAIRVDALRADPETIAPAALADLEGRTNAAIGGLAELRTALSGQRSTALPTDEAVRFAVAIEHVRQSEARLTDAANRLSGVGTASDPRMDELTRLERDLERLLLSPTETGVRVVDSAGAVPVAGGIVSGRSLGSEVRIGLASIAGLIVGLVGALGVEYGDKSVRNLDRLKSRTRLRPLGMSPRVPRMHLGIPQHRNGQPFELYEEALHTIATNIEEQATGNTLGPILVVSPQVHAGATAAAFNLARLFTRRQRRTLLIDANLRKPDLTCMLGFQDHVGLADVLEQHEDLMKSVVDLQGLAVLPVGKTSSSAVELLSSPMLRVLLEEARFSFDAVVIDCAPVLGFAETLVLAREAGQAMVVTDARRTTLGAADEAAERLEGVGVHVLGAMVNGMSPRSLKNLASPHYRRSVYVPSGPNGPGPAGPASGARRWLRVPAPITTFLK